MQIKDKIKNISKNKNVEFNVLLRNYMYERFIERLAYSKYRDNFILKGGYYLSILFGLDTRTTMDIDLSLKNAILSEDNVKNIVKEIIVLDIGDNAIISFDDIGVIREEDEYGGYRVKLTVKIDNIRETFNIDISTGDPITPRDIIYKYESMLDYKYIDLRSYNLETILAEKLETILSRKELSSRLKDYYDIYLIYTLAKDKINIKSLKSAVDKTFSKRNFQDNILNSFEIIKNSEILKSRWNSYTRKNKYAREVSYASIVDSFEKVINLIEKVGI